MRKVYVCTHNSGGNRMVEAFENVREMMLNR